MLRDLPRAISRPDRLSSTENMPSPGPANDSNVLADAAPRSRRRGPRFHHQQVKELQEDQIPLFESQYVSTPVARPQLPSLVFVSLAQFGLRDSTHTVKESRTFLIYCSFSALAVFNMYLKIQFLTLCLSYWRAWQVDQIECPPTIPNPAVQQIPCRLD